MLVILFILYWLPTIAAMMKGTNNKFGVFILNLFLGWTIGFWFVALAMAIKGSNVKTVYIVNQQKGE